MKGFFYVLMITSYRFILITSIIAINGIAYIIMCFDKYQSKKKGNRISENKLFLFAFILGAPGIYFGTKYPIYHKASKTSFKFGIPILVIVNVICIYFIFKFLS
ncbi:MAG: DUF1294 domain-containing protein [Burkholderiales bacterium]|nr:DUF1294 domain-containing protein [Bacteroidia bacterium]